MNARDNKNNTPLTIARGRNAHDAIEYLERKKLYKFSKNCDIRYLIIFISIYNAFNEVHLQDIHFWTR